MLDLHTFALHQYSEPACRWEYYRQVDLALYYAFIEFLFDLSSKWFAIETDHRNLCSKESSEVPNVQRNNFLLRHIKGKEKMVAVVYTMILSKRTLICTNGFPVIIHFYVSSNNSYSSYTYDK